MIGLELWEKKTFGSTAIRSKFGNDVRTYYLLHCSMPRKTDYARRQHEFSRVGRDIVRYYIATSTDSKSRLELSSARAKSPTGLSLSFRDILQKQTDRQRTAVPIIRNCLASLA